MGRPRKTPERRQNRATKDLDVVDAEVVELAPAGDNDVPEPDREWLAETKRQWYETLRSQLAGHYHETDMAALHRLFMWRDELTRARRSAKAMRRQANSEALVTGSKGQPVANPLFDVAASLDAQALTIEGKVTALEDRLGLSPKARLGLGLTREKGLNLAAQNAKLAEAIREAMGGGHASDPRALPRDPAVETA